MTTNLPSCFSIQFLEQLLKFLVNFTLLKYVKSQRSYGFLITKELISWLPNFGFKISLLSLLKNCSHLCSKRGLVNLASRWLFTLIIQGSNVIVGLMLLTDIETNAGENGFHVQREKISNLG